MDKKEIIANLYAIKTGMAAIAVQNEKLTEKQKEAPIEYDVLPFPT